jgi:hypothetical protein
MLDIDNRSKEQVYTVMRELLYSFNFMWFLMEDWIKKNCPEKIDSEDLKQLSETFGAYEARRLEKTMSEKKKGIDRLIQFIDHSHWRIFEDLDLAKLSETELRMRTLGCTAQKAARKWGMDCYNCSAPALRLRQGFFSQIDPSAQVTRIYTPPDKRPAKTPDAASCEWRISISG